MEFTVSAVTNVAITVENKECPICYDCVSNNVNTTTTECGHCFHTSCLLKSCSINGFNCPMCRNNMINNKKNAPATTTATQEEEDDAELDTETDFIRQMERSTRLMGMFELMGLLMRDRPNNLNRLMRPSLDNLSDLRIPSLDFTHTIDLQNDILSTLEQEEIDNYVENMIEQQNLGIENR